MRDGQAGEANALVSERVWRELELALGAAHPERAVEVLRDCGALAVILPELAQSPDLPLGLASLRCAANGVEDSTATPQRWATLLAGLPVSDIEALCTRLRTPTEHRQLALLAARLGAHLRSLGRPPEPAAADPEWLLGLLELADAFRRPERFAQWLAVLEARERAAGQPTAVAKGFAERLEAARLAAAAVQLREADLQAHRGAGIAVLLRARRLAALAAGR
jgi:tRNA nucleotidyltransferase (CCA-adding enzyme)